MNRKEQRIVLFCGTVQGVGFRYTAVRTARSFDVTGTVRNLADGRVECVVEGEAREIDAFLAELAKEMRSCLGKQTQQVAPYSGKYGDFTVAF